MKTLEKIREKILGMKEHRDSKAKCDMIRNEIFRLFESPNMMWQDTSKGRKAYRSVAKALSMTDNESMMRHIKTVDEIMGGEDW